MGVVSAMRGVVAVLLCVAVWEVGAYCPALTEKQSCDTMAGDDPAKTHFLGWLDSTDMDSCRILCEKKAKAGCCMYQQGSDGTSCFLMEERSATSGQCPGSLATMTQAASVCD